MARRDRESITDSDPHGLFFGSSDDDEAGVGEPDGLDGHHRPRPGGLPVLEQVSRSERRAERGSHAARRRNRRLLGLMSALLVLVIAAAAWLVVLPIYHYLHPSDYSGKGAGAVVIEVQANDNAKNIGTTLHDKGVVASVRAFTEAAGSNSRSHNIQPGSYRLRKHMSAKNALNLMLDPASRVDSDVVVTEGATSLDVLKRLTAPPCAANSSSSAVCGPGLDEAAVAKALKDVQAIGLPTDFTVNGKTPTSVEGFLYPATYFFSKDASPAVALQAMVTQFTDKARSINFAAAAAPLHVTPYQELIIASIVESEAKFPEDYPKVARVILNRIAASRPLQIDATSRYGARLEGLNPGKVNYATFDSPYNTYLHGGLTPTPISNPGTEAMSGAAHPAQGNWMFYVNGDADGHLFFTNSESEFTKAVATCKKNNWGCG
ncbi:MAG: endolytic transglycosylase MltG [Jatrophihabitans sp.]|uniref:endolytic transglycosylase MltG n=1 Tax=Jatrophihabitans sp. TaxID=1932789 RepID=UPI0039157183